MDNQDKIINKIKSAAQKAEHQDFPGMDKVWGRVEDKLDQKVLETKTKLWKKLAIAASLLLFISLGYQFFKKDSKNDAIIESTSIKVAVQKEKTLNDSIIPSDKIKPEATEILQKQLEKKNPVAVVENPTPKNDTKIIVSDKKAEESNIQADGIISQESNSILSVAPMASVAAKSLAPVANEYKQKAEIVSADKNTEKTITGIITDESNMPLPGVNVIIKGTKDTAVTDFDGKFSIEAEKGEQLIFNMIGYNSAYATVEKSNEINKKLNPNSASLNEVVVVGYGTARKNQPKNTAPIAKYGTTKFYKPEKEKSVPHIKDALYIINGVEYSEESLFGSNPTSPYAPLSKQKIETVQILQSKEATSIYGNKSKNGVIIITTKNGIPLKR
ncbi:carboxypeptidase-like regulatory domain-containing protein [Flavobacterium undicola]|uniref:carboxypeptidase-like regulatory domain-containing protein n=1 Tax=Flavobacterium undicola TaxID=1932779 RepID=UPI001377EA20|nr:carboxypeptidase-like regulatory domain-containing protein [Flavobacterium undicola]MBA0883951.1 carboxypeptidase-like regulatory domain-containing protein [Flavobacterium undicola]